MQKILTAVFVIMLLSSCATTPGNRSSLLPQQTVFYYGCDQKASFTARFDKQNDLFYITGLGGMRVLKHAISASGARYRDSVMTYWSKGDDATLEYKGKTYNCSINPQFSLVEDAKFRGVTFRAEGGEQAWTAEVTGNNIDIYLNGYSEKYSFIKADSEVNTKTGITVYKAEKDGHNLELVINKKRCEKGADGIPVGFKVEAVLDGKNYSGCGDKVK